MLGHKPFGKGEFRLATEAQPSGIRGMFGSVAEWVSDWEGARYLVDQSVVDPNGPPQGTIRGLRGGWFSLDTPLLLRVARPGHDYPGYGGLKDLSFRIVFVPSTPCGRESRFR
jgi:formylglycine-generating enzyme required for sulfatase activity